MSKDHNQVLRLLSKSPVVLETNGECCVNELEMRRSVLIGITEGIHKHR